MTEKEIDTILSLVQDYAGEVRDYGWLDNSPIYNELKKKLDNMRSVCYNSCTLLPNNMNEQS